MRLRPIQRPQLPHQRCYPVALFSIHLLRIYPTPFLLIPTFALGSSQRLPLGPERAHCQAAHFPLYDYRSPNSQFLKDRESHLSHHFLMSCICPRSHRWEDRLYHLLSCPTRRFDRLCGQIFSRGNPT